MMCQSLFETEYFIHWNQFIDLKESTKRGYISQFKKFNYFIAQNGMKGEIDFNNFYYCEDINDYEPIDINFIDQYIADLKSSKCSKHLLYLNICALKSLFCHLEEMEMIRVNPMRYYPNPYYQRVKLDRSLGNNECAKILKEAYKKEPFVKQYLILILVLMTCGLRAREVCSLTFSQINLEESTMKVNKGHKTHAKTIAIIPLLHRLLSEYFAHPYWVEWNKNGDRHVFFIDNKPLSYLKLRKIIDSIAQAAGLNRKITPHQFRHTMVNLMLESGIDPRYVQEQMRHQFFATTLLYAAPITLFNLDEDLLDSDH